MELVDNDSSLDFISWLLLRCDLFFSFCYTEFVDIVDPFCSGMISDASLLNTGSSFSIEHSSFYSFLGVLYESYMDYLCKVEAVGRLTIVLGFFSNVISKSGSMLIGRPL